MLRVPPSPRFSRLHCAPPDNKPEPAEIARCTEYLGEELACMPQVKAYLVLGGIALNALWPRVGGG
ncbi:MAG: uracil-DNA glycosylase, partial [Verrucomicrobia bacterium]|nr:uracil-DNA glycosylase [Verrucomicrobiota bacterium]